MTAAAKVIEDVRVRVANRATLQPHQVPAELQVGSLAHRQLSDAAGWRLVHGGRLLDALFGVSIVPAPEFNPWRWRLLGGMPSSEVIAEGFIDSS